MAVFVLKDASLVVNSINLSAYVSSITLDYAVDAVAADAMAATNGHVFLGGLQNNSRRQPLSSNRHRRRSEQQTRLTPFQTPFSPRHNRSQVRSAISLK